MENVGGCNLWVPLVATEKLDSLPHSAFRYKFPAWFYPVYDADTRFVKQREIGINGGRGRKTVGVFFSKSVKKSVKRGVRVLSARSAQASKPHTPLHTPEEKKISVSPQSRSLFSASFQTFCLTARAHLKTQNYWVRAFKKSAEADVE